MTPQGKRAQGTLIERVAGHVCQKHKAPAAAGQFVHQYYAHVPPEDLFTIREEDLTEGALSIWKFLQSRKPGESKIRIFNPDGPAANGARRQTVVEIVTEDKPFLVDSVTSELNRRNLTVNLVIHPVIHAHRNKAGRLATFEPPEAHHQNGATRESIMHVEINEQTMPETLERLRTSLLDVLSDVGAAVEDWRTMRGCLADAVAELDSTPPPVPSAECEEAKEFLRWLDADNYTFIGYREYVIKGGDKKTTLSVVPGASLGVLRNEARTVFEGMTDGAAVPPDIAAFLRQPTLIMLSKSNGRSTVHRSVHYDTIAIKQFDRSGKVVGQRLFVGLYTSDVYRHALGDMPILRRKVDFVLKHSGFPPESHDRKALMHILETLPRDDLFQFSDNDLLETALGVLHLQDRQRVALFARRDPFGRFVSCLVYVPRDRYTTALRERMQRIIEEGLGGQVSAFFTHLSEAVLARLQFIVKTTPGQTFPQELEEIRARLIEAGRDWSDDLSHALAVRHRGERGHALFRHYREAFPAHYRERFDADTAVSDIAKAEVALNAGVLQMELCRPANGQKNAVRFKIYNRDEPLPLSDVIPVLENMGLKVIDELPCNIAPMGRDGEVWLHDFGLEGSSAIEFMAVKSKFEDAFAHIWSGEAENDGFNRLVLGAGLTWRQIVILRAYCKYLLQAAIPFSQAYMERTVANNATIACMIVELFECMFDPNGGGAQDGRAERLRTRIERALDTVEVLDEDRILRRYLNVVTATLRTNYCQCAADGAPKPYVSFKLDSAAIDELPLPRPMVEIFVYSPKVESIHLRGGRVARGGIRWSDRREDFRTEILGLMKSQMTKNAVIVPVGAKGGFVVKQPPTTGGRESQVQEGIACYSTMMRGMLDLTDNLLPEGIVAPNDVVRRDSDDPYLVVAADKGTATFSDIANGVAREYGFWLDDAFASGGSAGYDHKKMGITARGAWESVMRHFRESNVDIQTTDFTCVAVGDMGGDVFGNGMLLSEHIKLIGAFNHLHIFVDPDPDPKVSFKERKRLFDTPPASWADYAPNLISRGGGVFERKAKSIKPTRQMRACFGLPEKDSVTPNELIRAMLATSADLLWFGGIGTFVKASDERHTEVGDRINDSVRIDAKDLRCKVIGEGANLGITQPGRIEYALGGGQINTDFIDNSAGVATSDHEVNIKILLGGIMADGKLTMAQRDDLLAQMTDELAEHVLMDNYRQSMELTHAQAQSMMILDEAVRFIRELERAGKFDRQVEFLPDDETLAERRAAGQALTRPELAVLLAYSKMTLYDELLDSDVPDDPFLVQDVGLYFPRPLRERFGDCIPEHRLRREITATYVTNSLINRTGPTFVCEIREKTGATASEIAKAYLTTRHIFGLRELWAEIESLDLRVSPEVQTAMNLDILRLIKRGTLWMLHNVQGSLDVTRTIGRYGPGIARLTERLEDCISPELRGNIGAAADRYIAQDVPEQIANRIASLEALFSGCDIVRIAEDGGYPVEPVATAYFAIGERFGLDWLRGTAESLPAETESHVMAIAAIVDDLYTQQSALTTKVVDESGGGAAADAVIEAWASANGHRVDRAGTRVDELKGAGTVDLAMLVVADREIRALLTR